MSAVGWLALAGAVSVTLLPAGRTARAGGLAADGRLEGQARRCARSGLVRAVPSRAVKVTGAATLAGTVAGAGPALGVAAAVVAGVVLLLVRDVLGTRRDRRRQRSLVTAVRLLSGELAAGAAPTDALAAAASTDDDARSLLGPAADAARSGADAAEVLARSRDPALRGLAVAWRLAATGGAALADVVDRVAADLAARDTERRAVEVAVAGPRSSAVLLSGLPLLGVALGASMGARPLGFLFGDPIGRVVCCAGVVLDAAGILWLRRIVRGVRS